MPSPPEKLVPRTCESSERARVSKRLKRKEKLKELKLYPDNRPLAIAENNSAAIAQANSGIKHVRNAKHYEIRLRFLQQKVVDKEVEFRYCPTEHQIAGFFTEPLGLWMRESSFGFGNP